MKRITIIASVLGLLVFICLAVIVFQKDSRPTIVCIPLDDGIRPKTYCVLNPFRSRDEEAIAERVLEELKNGNIDAVLPYCRDNTDKERYLENEVNYRIISWRVAEINISGDELRIQYWVLRSNYPWGEEEVRFFFNRTSKGWALQTYTAIY